MALAAVPSRPGAATTELVVVDHYTGLAIGGFDPVAYFTDGRPLLGRSEHEYTYGGAVWRFRNVGNRLIFIADPDAYGPRFGGYDVVGIGRGVAVAGNPMLWLIHAERLYLFSSRAARDAFTAEPEQVMAAAEQNWNAVQLLLSP
jgi:YHS domain-containing protein